MLKRANIAWMSAAAPGPLAYTGWIDVVTPAAKFVALGLLGFSVLSFLLALFEDEDPSSVVESTARDHLQASQPLTLVLNEAQTFRVAP